MQSDLMCAQSLKEIDSGLSKPQSSVAAIVVTFHPRPEYLLNLAKIQAQVDILIVVDNGSSEAELADLRESSGAPGFRLIENGANLGIATALNRGVHEAQLEGCTWVALFDQDSEVTPGFVATMIGDFKRLSSEEKILQIIPRYIDPETGVEREVSRFGDGGVFLTITSGSLFSLEAFKKCGLFEESLFIYCVDDDYSLRIRKSGFYIGASKTAVLLHQSGRPTSRRILGRLLTTKNYPPEVRYYYARNKLWILRRYALTFPRIILPTLRELIGILVKTALLEEDGLRKIWFAVRGLADGITGRMGPLNRTAGWNQT